MLMSVAPRAYVQGQVVIAIILAHSGINQSIVAVALLQRALTLPETVLLYAVGGQGIVGKCGQEQIKASTACSRPCGGTHTCLRTAASAIQVGLLSSWWETFWQSFK